MIIENINLMTFKTHSTLKSNFCIQDHFIKVPAVINNFHLLVDKEKLIYEIEFNDLKLKCYFGSGKSFKSVG